MSDDSKKDLEKKVAALPSVPKAFVEGYGEGVAGWKSDVSEEEPKQKRSRLRAPEGYDLNLGGATNRVCQRCGAVVADFDLHDKWHVVIQVLLDLHVWDEEGKAQHA